MSDLNNYCFTGRLGADAKLEYTQGGKPIWTARVAVDYGWGEEKRTNWINAKALGKQAESLGKLELAKGTKIGGSGVLQLREYDRQDGSKAWSHDVLCDGGIHLLSPKHEGGTARAPAQSRPKRTETPRGDFNDDSIPF